MKAARWLVLGLLALALLLFFALDLGQYLTLAALQQRQADLAALYATHPWQVRAAYFALYMAAATLALPGTALLTLAGGAIFGFGWGLALVSFAASLGATLSFWIARLLLRDVVRTRFALQVAEIDAGVRRAGWLYLLSLRLIPVVPFFLINLTMGLTALRTRTFYAASQLGMLPATAVFVNAGMQLGALRSLADVASVGLLGSLALLGLFPVLVHRLRRHLERLRVLAPWRGSRPRTFDRNLVVIGGGAAGLVSAYVAAAVRARVTLVEAHALGGDCLHTGCVPSKALIRSARLAQQMRRADALGLPAVEPALDWPRLMRRVQEVIAAIAPHDSAERYTALGVDVVQGHARITNPWTVEVTRADGSTQALTTRSIVLATGARPVLPPLPGLDAVGALTSETLWAHLATLDALPRRWVVLGGGPVGCELAQALAGLGAEVCLVEMAWRLLEREDDEVSALAQAALEADGVRVLCGRRALRCEVDAAGAGGQRWLVLQQPDGELRLPLERLLCAVGRAARLDGYGLEALGIPTERTVLTDDCLQTIYPHIYAAGDVAGPWQLTHVAAHQAWYAAVNALFGDFKRFRVNNQAIPQVTFLEPEIARVGLNERAARAQGVPFEVTRFDIGELDRAIADGTAHGFVKVLTVPGKDRILGVTIVGAQAGELLAEYVLAMRHGLGLGKVLGTVHAYPTLAEANRHAAGLWRQNHAPQSLLSWLEKFHTWRRG